MLAGLALAGATPLVAGCGSLGGGAAAETFDLSAPRDVGGARGTAAQILVPEPQALKALDTERIVVRPKPSEINYLSGSQWSDRLPRLFQARLLQTFENTGRIRAAGRPGQGLLIDWQVVTDLRAFEYDAASKKAVIEISAKLMNDRNGKVVATEVFRTEVDSEGEAPSRIVAALDGALDHELRAIVGWTLKRI